MLYLYLYAQLQLTISLMDVDHGVWPIQKLLRISDSHCDIWLVSPSGT